MGGLLLDFFVLTSSELEPSIGAYLASHATFLGTGMQQPMRKALQIKAVADAPPGGTGREA